MRATSEDYEVASLMGIDVNRSISLTFGVLAGMYFNSVHPLMGVSVGLKSFCAAVLGGITWSFKEGHKSNPPEGGFNL